MWWIILYIPLIYIGLIASYFLVYDPIKRIIQLHFKHDFSLLSSIKGAYGHEFGQVVFETIEHIVLLPFCFDQ